jgi:archaemetzincin
MTPLAVVAVGPVPAGLAEHVAEFLGRTLRLEVRLLDDLIDPMPAFDRERRQYDCRRLLPELERIAGREEGRILAVADVDLFSPVFTFVFGEARVGGRVALFSITRLRASYYGLPEDPALLLARARREALHETGHMLGLIHCRQPDCVMRFSAAAEEVDLKGEAFCSECLERVSG